MTDDLNQNPNKNQEIPPVPDITNIPDIPELNDDLTLTSNENINIEDPNSIEPDKTVISDIKAENQQHTSYQSKGFGPEHHEFNRQKEIEEEKLYAKNTNNSYSSNKSQTPPNIPPQNNNYLYQQNLPNSSAILTFGILSILTICCCGSFVPTIFAVIALAMAGKPLQLYKQNPGQYTYSSYNNIKTGKICAIIGLILSILVLIIFILNMIFNGEFQYQFNEIINETWDQSGY
ncbi:MAG: CCC motif membrane protein [Bacteroidales bacterium]|jgi:hypothetical protein|nr:CCC motif membrane protein [Bacteroidales bacterium]HOL97502.1 CCC motif membrane protein [Bacteroidales bacterium]HOM35770.1 CCC motif membrane protein [Bacteroidales bacterium]HPD23012.1 CCC motif membrane protein [Bacteroidales bacterium]HRS98851.1 CCC motif membrane protein [Bacteroidales bacterium]